MAIFFVLAFMILLEILPHRIGLMCFLGVMLVRGLCDWLGQANYDFITIATTVNIAMILILFYR